MSKGIRNYVNALFVELSPKRIAGEYGPIDNYLAAGNRLFRKDVKQRAELQFSITDASSSTAYNKAFQECKKNFPELVIGLGRPEDKKGGRKAGSVNTVTPETPAAETPAAETPAAVVDTVVDTAPVVAAVEPTAAAVKIQVTRAKDGAVVAEVDTMEEAQALIDKAAKAKKAKLQIAA